MKTIKHLLSVFVISSAPFLYSNCVVQENDLISQQCPIRCTSVQGRVTTDGRSRGLSDVHLELFWENRSILGGVIRKKAQAVTDAQGYYRFKFLLREDELIDGWHHVTVMPMDPTVFINLLHSEIPLPSLQRDTFHETGLVVLPKKSFVRFNLAGQSSMNDGDYVRFSIGYQLGQDGDMSYKHQQFTKNTPPGDFLPIAGNQPTYIWIQRKKNGVVSEKRDTLLIRARARTDYHFDFNN